jgi:hypothetical protein
MVRRIQLALWLSLLAAGCSGTVAPTQPTSSPAGAATIGSVPALNAQTPGQSLNNGDVVHQCLDGWQTLVRNDGTHFRNLGDCVHYAAQGGTFGSGGTVYTLRVTGTEIGDFGWSLATPGLITSTSSYSSFLSTSSTAGCTISGVTINNPSSADPFVETFFSPGCPGGGLVWTEFAQTFWNAGPFDSPGVYVPVGVVGPQWTLTITN